MREATRLADERMSGAGARARGVARHARLAVALAVLLCAVLFPQRAWATSKTADEAIAWCQSKVGQYIDADGAYGAQCVDLIKAYYEYLGVSSVSGNGADYRYNSLPSGWTRVQGGQPQKGDILVYTGGYNNYGHVGIYESDYSSYHQNVDSSPVKHVTWKYNGFSTPYWGYIRPNFSTGTSSNPIGAFDTAVGGNGQITVSGWAFDPDSPSSSIDVHVYVGGEAGTGTCEAVITTNTYRSDVNSYYGITGNHGFSATFNTSQVGTKAVHIYAINVGSGTTNPQIGSGKTVTIASGNPKGNLDSATGGARTITVKGWAYDPNQPSTSLTIDIYVGGPAGTGEKHRITANVYRKDVNAAYGITGNHGFEATFSTEKLGGVYAVYVYALNVGPGSVTGGATDPNTLIGIKSARTYYCDSSSPSSYHSFGSWTTTKTATYTSTGLRERTCSTCGYKQSKAIARLGTTIMYRLYNPNSGEHFYTSDEAERANVLAAGWNDEGVGWTAPASSNTPVYRLYNANGGEHHFTTSTAERDNLVKLGWKYEGIGWYSDDAKSVPLYRQYNPNAFANNHNYTTSKSENDWLVSLGWRAEGIGWYGV